MKSTEWSRGEIRITHFSFLSSRPCFLTGKQNKINLIFTFKAFGNYFSSVWMSMFSSVDFFGSKYMWLNSQGSVRKALNIVHPPFLQKFPLCMHRFVYLSLSLCSLLGGILRQTHFHWQVKLDYWIRNWNRWCASTERSKGKTAVVNSSVGKPGYTRTIFASIGQIYNWCIIPD